MLFPSQIAFHTPQLFGFYLPPLMLWCLLAVPPFLLLRWGLGRGGFYRLVWHRALFDAALYVIVLGGVMLMLGLQAVAGGAR